MRMRTYELPACFDLLGSFLDEAAERGQTSAGTEHDDRRVFYVRRWVEGSMARLDCYMNAVALFDAAEVVRRNAEEALGGPSFGGSVEDGPGQCRGRRIVEW